jgi:hypothetical protein
MHDKSIRRFGRVGISSGAGFGIVCGLLAACAGGDTPPRDSDLDDRIAAVYAGATLPPAGGSGGSGAAPSNGGSGGGTPTANGGSGGAPPSGGSGGGAMSGEAGSGTSAAGSGGEMPPPEPAGCDGFALLQERCGAGPCHGAASTVSGFATSEGDAADFAGEDAEGPSCGGDGPIFDPANPPASLVILKIDGTVPCGSPMPLGGATFTAEEIECVQDFISTL